MNLAKRPAPVDDPLWVDEMERELGTRDVREANRRARVKWEWELDNGK